MASLLGENAYIRSFHLTPNSTTAASKRWHCNVGCYPRMAVLQGRVQLTPGSFSRARPKSSCAPAPFPCPQALPPVHTPSSQPRQSLAAAQAPASHHLSPHPRSARWPLQKARCGGSCPAGQELAAAAVVAAAAKLVTALPAAGSASGRPTVPARPGPPLGKGSAPARKAAGRQRRL